MSSKIEWTDEVWNPVVGCSRVSAGCENCYAQRVAHRGMAEQHRGLTVMGPKGPRWTGEVRFVQSALDKPLRWRKPRRVFVNSMSDLFHEGLSNEQIAAVFGVMAASPQHTFQVLTKRPARMAEWFRWADGDPVLDVSAIVHDAMGRFYNDIHPGSKPIDFDSPYTRACYSVLDDLDVWPLPNVWLGCSVEDQATADERIPLLLDTPAALHWVSYEPALGPVDFARLRYAPGMVIDAVAGTCGVSCPPPHDYSPSRHPGLDWLVVGGESGPGARPFNVEWARSVIRQCRDAGVACFVKQLGALPYEGDETMHFGLDLRDRKGGDWSEWAPALRVREMPEVSRG